MKSFLFKIVMYTTNRYHTYHDMEYKNETANINMLQSTGKAHCIAKSCTRSLNMDRSVGIINIKIPIQRQR